jgi:hypothetical protein
MLRSGQKSDRRFFSRCFVVVLLLATGAEAPQYVDENEYSYWGMLSAALGCPAAFSTTCMDHYDCDPTDGTVYVQCNTGNGEIYKL